LSTASRIASAWALASMAFDRKQVKEVSGTPTSVNFLINR